MMKIIAKIRRENNKTIRETAEEERRILGLPMYPSTRKSSNRNSLSPDINGNSPKTFSMRRALMNS